MRGPRSILIGRKGYRKAQYIAPLIQITDDIAAKWANGNGSNGHANGNTYHSELPDDGYQELWDQAQALREFMGMDPAQRLVKYIKRSGWHKGELLNLTPRQFEELVGCPPKQAVIINGRVPWEYALDQVSDALGYASDQHLHDAVEQALEHRRELEAIERKLATMEASYG